MAVQQSLGIGLGRVYFSFPAEAEIERGVKYCWGIERQARAVEADVLALQARAIRAKIVARLATARIVVR